MVILAAGAGSRFVGEGHKLLAPLDDEGTSVLRASVSAALDAGLDQVLVLWGAVPVKDALEGLDVTLVHHPDWGHGQASTLWAGLNAARSHGHDCVVIGLGDQPMVPATAWRAVADAPDHPPVVFATFDGHAAPPVRLPEVVWELLPMSGEIGARALLADRPDLVQHVGVDGSAADVDTIADLETLRRARP